MQSNADEVLTIEGLSAYLKVSKSTLYALAREGALPGAKVGKHWRFHKGAIERWLISHPEQRKTRRRPRVKES